jgi:hypothetical protein
MRKFTTLVLAATVGLLASAHVAGAETVNSKAQQKMFNPQPDPPGATAKSNPASQPAKAKMGQPPDDSRSSKMGVSPEPFGPGTKAGKTSIIPIGGGHAKKKMSNPPGNGASAKGIIVINNKPGGAGAGASAKGLLPAIQAPAGKR